jgi:hypothetical protein
MAPLASQALLRIVVPPAGEPPGPSNARDWSGCASCRTAQYLCGEIEGGDKHESVLHAQLPFARLKLAAYGRCSNGNSTVIGKDR